MAPVWLFVTEILASFTTAPLWSVTSTTMAELLGDCPPPPRLRRGAAAAAVAAAGVGRARSEQKSRSADKRTENTSRLLGNDHVVFEIAGAVGLGPESDLARHGRTKPRMVRGEQVRVGRSAVAAGTRLTAEHVLERAPAVTHGLEVGLIDGQLQLVPLAAIEHELVVAAAELH